MGIINPTSETVNGTALSIIKSGKVSGTAYITSTLDNQKSITSLNISVKPSIDSTTPSNNSRINWKTSSIKINLSEPVEPGNGFGEITLTGPSGKVKTSQNILNNILTIYASSDLADGTYKIYIPFNGLKDFNNNVLKQSFYSYFTVDNRKPTVSIYHNGGFYNATKTVYLKIDEPGIIYYTLDNSRPTKTSSKYINPLKISKTTILKYLAFDTSGNQSNTGTVTYIIDRNPPRIVATSPNRFQRDVSTVSTVKIYFNENIKPGINFGQIKIKNLNTGRYVSVSKTINGNMLTIKNLKTKATWYTLILPEGSVVDKAGNKLKQNYLLEFRTRN